MSIDLSNLTRLYIRRESNPEQLQMLFKNVEHLNDMLTGGVDASLRGQFVEFLRQEYLQLNGYSLYDKYGNIEDTNFKYAGSDRADIRASWVDPSNPTNVDIFVETSKVKKSALGVGSSEVEGILIEANKLVRQLGVSSARITLGIVGGEAGVTKGIEKWFSSVRADNPNLHAYKVYGPDDMVSWFKNVSVHYERAEWQYRVQPIDTGLPNLHLWWHQERLSSRWALRMQKEKVKLLVVWGCRTGKTVGSLALIRKYIENNNNKKIRVAIVCSIPTLFHDWTKSIQQVYGNTAVIHRHRSNTEPPADSLKNLFILSSSQMLNEEDKEHGVDKETNKKVMYDKPFDILIYDEGHQGLLADNTYKQVIKKIKHRHLIGLTATPFRTGLQNDTIFKYRDVFDYWQQMQMKQEGHPDYLNAATRFLFTLKMSSKAKKLFRDLDLTDFGANISSIYTDSRQMDAALYVLNEFVFAPKLLMKDATHRVKDIIIRADSVAGGKVLLDALRNYVDPMGQRPLQNHLFGLVTGSNSDLPGVEAGFDGVGADNFKNHVSSFFKQNTNHTRKVLIVVDQGIVGHTFETVNTTIDLTNGESLISKYQFWDRGGSRYVYPDGYEKNTYYHFDLNPYRLLGMAKAMRDTKRSDKETEYSDSQFFDLLNLYEIEDGVNFVQINQTLFKSKIDEMLEINKLSQILPNAGMLVVNDGVFDQFLISKPKNGFGSTSFDPIENENLDIDAPDKTSTSKRNKLGSIKRTSGVNLEPNTKNAIERIVNGIPMLAALIAIDDRNKTFNLTE